jgi:NodT family efflux transporter outer membrane factor (OMF) lipoprotein
VSFVLFVTGFSFRSVDRKVRLLGSVMLTVALVGCDIGPDYHKPQSETPQTWTTPVEKKPETVWPSPDWWQSFASPELNRLMAQAQSANYDLGAAAARIVQADAQARIAGAPLLPAISGAASVTQEQTGPTTTNLGTGNPKYYSSTATGSASYELDFWGKNKAGLDAAVSTAISTRYDRETLALSIVGSVAATYFQILATRDRIEVLRTNIDRSQSVLQALRTENDVGAGSALDVAQQETTVAGLLAQEPPLRQQLQEGIDALAILIGKPPQMVAVAGTTLEGLAEPTIAPGLPSELLTRRPDVASAEEQLIAANANIKAARAQMFPSIDLTAQGGVVSTALNTAFGPGGILYALTAGVTQPIFEGGKLEAGADVARGRYAELEQVYGKAVVSAFGDVEDSLVSVKETAEQVRLLQDEVDKAHHAYDIALEQLKVGTDNLLTVLTIENILFPAQDALVQAKVAHMQAIVSLFKALGGGWQRPTKPPVETPNILQLLKNSLQ